MSNFQADFSPQHYASLEKERDAALAESARLRQELADYHSADEQIRAMVLNIEDENAALQAEVERLKQDNADLEESCAAFEAKLKSLAPHGSCGCSYDRPGALCLHHSPQVAALQAEVSELKQKYECECTCGSGGHPRECKRHPLAYKLHALTLDYDNAQEEIADLQAEVSRLTRELLKLDDAAL